MEVTLFAYLFSYNCLKARSNPEKMLVDPPEFIMSIVWIRFALFIGVTADKGEILCAVLSNCIRQILSFSPKNSRTNLIVSFTQSSF
jgi:hypothetical protein